MPCGRASLGLTTPSAPTACVHACMRRGSLYAMLHSPSLQLSWAALALMCAGAAAGMRHLHAHAVLHRDLKSGARGRSLPTCAAACTGWLLALHVRAGCAAELSRDPFGQARWTTAPADCACFRFALCMHMYVHCVNHIMQC